MEEYSTETPLACDPKEELAVDTMETITGPDTAIFVTPDIQGMVIAGVIRAPKYLGVRGTITGLYIAPESRGGRSAWELLQAARQWLHAQGVKQLQILQPVGSPLARFHEKHGLRPIASMLVGDLEE